jgi:carbazole 1,9a-dioxygenase terminal dioxygenase component
MTTDERSEPDHDSLSEAAQSKKVSTKWRGYLDATLGFRNHWNPVGYGHEIAEGAFLAVTALDEPILLTRVDGEVRAIQDRCAHRGARFSAQPLCLRKGTVSCWYHGWTYDLADGRLSDVLTSPGSPVIGRVRVPVYPVVEAQGLVFVYVGDGDPPALAHDVPPGFLDEDTHCLGIRRTVKSNWRIGVENGFDTTHIFMHRNSALIKGNNIALPLGFVPTDRGAVQVHGEGWPKGVVDNLSENNVPVFEASLQGVPVWTSELRGDEKRVAGRISLAPGGPQGGSVPGPQPHPVRVLRPHLGHGARVLPGPPAQSHLRAGRRDLREGVRRDLAGPGPPQLQRRRRVAREELEEFYRDGDGWSNERLFPPDMCIVEWRRLASAHGRGTQPPFNGRR